MTWKVSRVVAILYHGAQKAPTPQQRHNGPVAQSRSNELAYKSHFDTGHLEFRREVTSDVS